MTAAGGTRRSLWICAAAATLGVVWGMVLPAALRCGPVARHVARMEAAGVNPAAMYYTELQRLPVRPAWIDQRIVRWPWPLPGSEHRLDPSPAPHR